MLGNIQSPRVDAFVARIQTIAFGLLLPATIWAGGEFIRMRDAVQLFRSETERLTTAADTMKREAGAQREGDQREWRSRFEYLGERVMRLEAARERDEASDRLGREAIARLTVLVEQLDRNVRGQPHTPAPPPR